MTSAAKITYYPTYRTILTACEQDHVRKHPGNSCPACNGTYSIQATIHYPTKFVQVTSKLRTYDGQWGRVLGLAGYGPTGIPLLEVDLGYKFANGKLVPDGTGPIIRFAVDELQSRNELE